MAGPGDLFPDNSSERMKRKRLPQGLRRLVRTRAQHRCERCTAAPPCGEIDHRLPLSDGGTDDPANLQWLCVPCHQEKTAGEAMEALTRGRRADAAYYASPAFCEAHDAFATRLLAERAV